MGENSPQPGAEQTEANQLADDEESGKSDDLTTLSEHDLAARFADLLTATDESSIRERARVQAELARRRMIEQEQAGFMAIDEQGPEALSEEERRRRKELKRAEKKFEDKPPHWSRD